jgi:hypothetical protein
MSGIATAPIQEAVIEQDGISTIQWTLFFNRVAAGDAGTEWTPVFANLTEAGGAASITGTYVYLTKRLVFFRVTITPAASGSTSSTSGSTAITNFPLTLAESGVVAAAYSLGGTTTGMINAGDNAIYPPSWTTISIPVTLVGIAEVL